jgi:hypothetical protein
MSKLPLIAALLASLAVVAGVLLGIQTVKAQNRSKLMTVLEFQLANNINPKAELVRERLPKAELLDPAEHDFGHIGYLETTRIPFKIKNVGGSDLRIDYRQLVSCGKCTWVEIPTSGFPPGVKNAPESRDSLIVSPGAVATVTVVFTQKNKEYTNHVSEWAKVHLSDPTLKEVEFRISGKITKAYRLTNDKFNLADVTVGQSHESRLGVFGYDLNKPLKLDKVEFISEVRDSDFTVRIEPMPEEQIKAEAGATSGYELVLTANKPPLGRINHQLRLHVANAEPPTVDIAVQGNVVGNIQVTPILSNPKVQWNRTQNYLDWAVVDGKTGDELTLNLRAKMPADAPFIQFKVKEVYPDFIQTEIGDSIRGSNAQIVPLKIRIPAGTKPVNFRSLSVDAKPSHIVIETNDPVTPEIVIGLRFGVE